MKKAIIIVVLVMALITIVPALDFKLDVLYEHNNLTDDTTLAGPSYRLEDPDIICQNFTIGASGPARSFIPKGVSMKVAGDAGEDNNLSVMITNKTGEGWPNFNNSAILCLNKSMPLLQSSPSSWQNTSLNSTAGGLCPTLNGSAQYWLCINSTEAGTNQPLFRVETTTDYTGGELWYYNEDASAAWLNNSGGISGYNSSLMFEIYGDAGDTTFPLVEITAPSGTINLTSNDTSLTFTRSDAIGLSACWYSIDGNATNITIPNCNNATINITHGNQTVTVWVNDTSNHVNYSASNFYGSPLFARCNSTLPTAVLNYTFQNEDTLTSLNATIDDAIFTYWFDDPQVNRTYTNSTTKNHSSIAFCVYPNYTNITTNATIKYSETGFPQRIHTISGLSYNNSTSNEVLYMLASADGIYVTFQVVTQAAQPISEVEVTAERYSAGSYTLIGTGETGDDGGVTFWLDPNYQHRFNFTKTGYDDESLVITPTQSQYTVVMGDEVTTNASSTSRGISYQIEPLNATLINDTTYEFNFTITSTYWDLDSWGFILKNGSGNEIARNSSTTGTGGTVKIYANTINNSSVAMYYFWNIDGNYSNATRTWYVYDTYGAGWSLKQFFDHLRDYTDQEIFGLNQFSRTLIIFVFIFMVVGLMSYYSGMYSPAIILVEVAVLITLFDVGLNMIANPIGAVNHFPTIFTWFIAIAVGAGEWFR